MHLWLATFSSTFPAFKQLLNVVYKLIKNCSLCEQKQSEITYHQSSWEVISADINIFTLWLDEYIFRGRKENKKINSSTPNRESSWEPSAEAIKKVIMPMDRESTRHKSQVCITKEHLRQTYVLDFWSITARYWKLSQKNKLLPPNSVSIDEMKAIQRQLDLRNFSLQLHNKLLMNVHFRIAQNLSEVITIRHWHLYCWWHKTYIIYSISDSTYTKNYEHPRDGS